MKFNATILLTGLLIISSIPSRGQTSISGVINQYTEVISVDFCNNNAVVDDPSGFAVGDRVLLIQMKGATTDLADNALYGNITDYRNAGNFEIAEIANINVNIVTFAEGILRMYDNDGAIQMVSIPQYTDVDIDDTLTCATWNDSTGGVLIFEASGTVTMNADVDVSGKGFNGGAATDHPICVNGGAGSISYRCDASGMCGGNKGAGISDPGTANFGRGAIANGGGGGNDHNTGGGGGSNHGNGGQGGERRNTSGADCLGDNPGIGGYPLTYSNADQKVFMGGGGGAGDQNQGEGTGGGNGGGIVVIIANILDGNNASILARGETVVDTAHLDAAGGGGGGGAVILINPTFPSIVNIDVSGGDGGHVDNGMDPDSCFGPGGGGGGGALWVSGAALSANINFTSNGGVAGRNVNLNAPAGCFNSTNNATAGTGGTALTGCIIPEGPDNFIPLSVTAIGDTTICPGEPVNLSATGTATGGPVFNWSEGSMTANIQVSPLATTIYTVSVTDNRGCTVVDQVFVTVVSSQVTAVAMPDTITEGDTVQLNASNSLPSQFSWTPEGLVSDTGSSSPFATPLSTTTFCVDAIDSNGCESQACVMVWVDTIPDTLETALFAIPNAFSPNGDNRNETFYVLTQGPVEISDFRIYNRKGVLIHETLQPWDGRYKDEDQPVGNYVYITTFTNLNTMEVFKRTGVVSLIR